MMLAKRQEQSRKISPCQKLKQFAKILRLQVELAQVKMLVKEHVNMDTGFTVTRLKIDCVL